MIYSLESENSLLKHSPMNLDEYFIIEIIHKTEICNPEIHKIRNEFSDFPNFTSFFRIWNFFYLYISNPHQPFMNSI